MNSSFGEEKMERKPKRYELKSKAIDEFKGEYAFLSNFYFIDVMGYPSNEHFFQAQKTTDKKIREQIKNLLTPGQAKRMGRKIKLRPEWNEIEFRICAMYKGLIAKFKNEELKQKLLNTGDVELIEGNIWHDNTWGSCFCPKCKNIKGENYLGKLLMKLREELRNGSSNK